MLPFEIVILGGGPGGITAARKLRQAGKSVALVEHAHWGGAYLNYGRISTKMLLGAVAPGAALNALQRGRVIRGGTIELDVAALQNRIRRFILDTRQSLSKDLTGLGVSLFTGRGVCTGPGRVRVFTTQGDKELAGACIILACGTSPAVFPSLAPDNDCILNSTELLRIAEVPESIIILGSEAIGLELGDFFAAVGSKVTIIEPAPHIAPLEDPDIAEEFLRALNKKGIVCHEGTRVTQLRTWGAQAELTLEHGRVITADKALIALGRTPNTAGLGAENAGCILDERGYVTVNSRLEAAHNMYAIGDVNGMAILPHAGEHQAHYVANRILGKEGGEYASGPIPTCIHGGTEIMRVGQTAQALLENGKSVEVSRAPFSMNPMARASGDTSGFVKVVWDKGRIAGIAAVGHGVSHLVTAAQLLVKGSYGGSKLQEVMFAHPTLDELLPMAITAHKTTISGK